jgi:23S rRNA pseudouridine955/2504/2580 synthase
MIYIMKTFIITANESGQRLDRFLKKYLCASPLSLIYRLIRKDVKINGKRKAIDYMLEEGDELALHISDERIEELTRRGAGDGARARPRIRFKVCYEDENILAVSKPYGLLTHGDEREKKDTLVNQVVGYLLDKGGYDPAAERIFTPSPVNRLDRNTTGLVVFGKNPKAVRDFSRMIASEDAVRKYYMALVLGEIEEELTLEGGILKDEARNRVTISSEGKFSRTIVCPVETFWVGRKGAIPEHRPGIREPSSPTQFTLAEVWLVTGRPHQIRAHLAASGHPVAGDPKYGDRRANEWFAKRCGLASQFLHAHKLVVAEGRGSLEYLTGAVIESPLPHRLAAVTDSLKKTARL